MATTSDIVKDIEDKETLLSASYNLRRLLWDKNILKYKGYHWIERNRSTNRWESSTYRFTKINKGYPTPVTNFVFDKVETVRSNIVKTFPLPYITSRVGTEKAKRASHFSDVAIKYYYDTNKINYRDIISKEVGWGLLTGGWIAIPYWNTDTGKFVVEYEKEQIREYTPAKKKICSNCEAVNEMSAQQCRVCTGTNMMVIDTQDEKITEIENKDKIQDKYPLGEPAIEISPYYEWYFNPMVEELEHSDWVMRFQVKSNDWIEDKYNIKVKNNAFDSNLGWHVQRINQWIGGDVNANNVTADSRAALNENSVIKEYWHLPSKKYPKGLHAIICGDDECQKKEFPWKDGKYHFYHGRFAKVMGALHGMSFAEIIIPINDMVNRIDQQLIWSRHLVIDPILDNPINSGIDNSELEGFKGRIVRSSDPNFKPGYIQPDMSYLQHAFKEREVRMSDLESIGVPDLMGGKLPEARTQWATVNTMLERASSKLAGFIINLIDCNVKVTWEILRLIKENMTDKRKFDIMGQEEEYEVQAFQGTDIEGDTDFENGGIQVQISLDDAEPKSRAAEKQMFIEAMQAGMQLPQDPLAQAKMYEVFGLEKKGINAAVTIDQKAAQREIVEMEAGIDITEQYLQKYGQPIMPGENTMIHREVHRRDIQSEKYAKSDEKIQAVKYKHFMMTEQVFQQQQQQQLMQQAQMALVQKGAPAPQKPSM